MQDFYVQRQYISNTPISDNYVTGADGLLITYEPFYDEKFLIAFSISVDSD